MILLWLVACELGASEDGDVGVSAEAHALESRSFRFCHEAGADAEAMLDWCDQLDRIPKERCPGIHETCAGAEPIPPSGCNRSGGGAGDGEKGLASKPEAPAEPWSFEASMPDMDFLGEVLRWVMALLVAGGVLVLLRVLWARFGGRKQQPTTPLPTVDVVVDEEELNEALPEVPAAPSDDLLTMARRALDEGRAGEAVVLARGAALRRLGETGQLRLHRSRTDREYVRAMEESADMAASLRIVTAMVEVFRFGSREPPADGAREALEAAARILKVLLCAVVLGVSGTSSAQTPERFEAYGDAGFRELFVQRGYEATWRLRALDAMAPEDADALFLDVRGVDTSEEEWVALRAWVEQGGVLLAVGDASAGFPDLGMVVSSDEPARVVEGTLRREGVVAPWLPGPVDVYQGGMFDTWIETDDGAVLAVLWQGRGVVVSLADWRFGDNVMLADPANEVLVGDILYHGQGLHGWPIPTPAKVQLATRSALSTEDQANNPLESLARAELLPFVLQFLLFWVVVALWRGWPFGPLRDPPEEGRTRFADHVEALGDRYRRLRASRHVLHAYATLWMQRLGPTGLQLAAVNYGMSTERAASFVAELEALLQQEPDPAAAPNASMDFQRMEELWKVVEHRDQGGRHDSDE